MNKEHDSSCYHTLELQPGASPDEVKAAFRRLVKLYHPDRDQSLDAEVKYNEIRVAYKMLRQHSFTGSAGIESNSSEQATQAPENWVPEHPVYYKFEWKRLSYKLICFLKDILSVGAFFKGFFVLIFALWSCYGHHAWRDVTTSMPPYAALAIPFYLITWISFIFLRIFLRSYFVPWSWRSSTRFFVGILYGLMLMFLIICFYTVPMNHLVSTGLLAAISAWFLMMNSDSSLAAWT